MANTSTTTAPQVFELLRKARNGKGLSYRALSEECHLSWGHLSQIENGRIGMSWGTCVLLAEVLDLDRYELWAARPPVLPYPRPALRSAA